MELILANPIRNLVQILLIGSLILFVSNVALADPDRPPGRIVFLGKTADNQKSVWLSLTTRGDFEVEARKQIVDSWTQLEAGLHVTLSPVVSNGSGDPHSLFQVINGELVFIDKDNQQGGITFPPLPGDLPPGEPTHPIVIPGEPTHPIVIPGEPTHPIVIPGEPTHPIVIPGEPTHPIVIPGEPTHPIVIPGEPTHPIVIPGEPTHPIVIPGEPTHPIVIPGEPTHPIVIPGEPTHPIVIPGEPTHPIVIPGEPTHPIVIPGEPTHPIIKPGEPTHPIIKPGEPTHPIVLPPSTGSSSPPVSNNNGERNILLARSNKSINAVYTNIAPLTRHRQFAKQPFLNVWADTRYYDIADYRFGLDRNGFANSLTIGVDRRVNKDLVIGAMASKNTAKSSCFNDNWRGKSKGFTFAPYFGYLFSPNWAVEGTIGYGQTENRHTIAILNNKYITQIYSTSVIATGVYNIGKIQIRSKPAIYFNYFYNAGYNINGNLNGSLFSIPVPSDEFAFGFSQFALEASRPFLSANEKITMVPYIELGINYAFTRPNGGQILTGNLLMQKTSPFSGLARAGVKAFITQSFFIDAGGSYLSLGQRNLNIWMGKISLSWAFY